MIKFGWFGVFQNTLTREISKIGYVLCHRLQIQGTYFVIVLRLIFQTVLDRRTEIYVGPIHGRRKTDVIVLPRKFCSLRAVVD